MSDLFWLTDAQMERLRPFFPKSRGKPRVDDRRVLERDDLHQAQRVALVRW
jgi:transposase